MKVLSTSLELKDNTGACAFTRITAESNYQGLNVGEYNTSSRRNREDRFKNAAVFCFHDIVIAHYAITSK